VALVFLLVLVITAFFLLVYRQGKRKPAVPVPVPAEHKPYAYLVLQDETKMRYPITRSSWRIGRGNDNEMTLQDNSVSRRHAEINRDKGDVFTIFDLDSLNGIFVNNNKVTKQILREGDTIEIGDVALRFTMFSNEYSMEDSTVMQHTKTPLTH
jgi:FOG: FHA domain